MTTYPEPQQLLRDELHRCQEKLEKHVRECEQQETMKAYEKARADLLKRALIVLSEKCDEE